MKLSVDLVNTPQTVWDKKLMMERSKDYIYDLTSKNQEELDMILSAERRNNSDDLDVRPEDSVSNIGIGSRYRTTKQYERKQESGTRVSVSSHSSSASSSRTRTSSALQRAMVKEIELAAEAQIIHQSNELKQRKRQLLRRLDDEVARQEIERKVMEEEIRMTQQRAARQQYQREIEETETRLQELETEMNIMTKFRAARATTKVLKESESRSHSVASMRGKGFHSYSSVGLGLFDSGLKSSERETTNRMEKKTTLSANEPLVTMPRSYQTRSYAENEQYISMREPERKSTLPTSVTKPKSYQNMSGVKKEESGIDLTEIKSTLGQSAPPPEVTKPKPHYFGNPEDGDDFITTDRRSEPYYFGNPQEEYINVTERKSTVTTKMPAVATPLPHQDTRNRESEESTNMTKILNKLVQQSREQALPKPELKQFDGTDMLEYPTFLKNFKFVVEDYTEDPVRRLEMLLKYTAKDAHELIKQCPLIEPPEAGYMRALWLLKRDYGQPAILAAAYISKADSWPRIGLGDKDSLRRFSIFLTNCVGAQQGSSEATSMDSYDFLRKLASKLPVALQQQWIREVGKYSEIGKSPTLDDFEHFVSRISRAENDPRVAGLGYQGRNNRENSSNCKNKAISAKKAYATHTTVKPSAKGGTEQKNKAAVAPCLYCGDGTKHPLLECRKFTALENRDKSDYCFKKGLCFGCVNPGHLKKNCPNKAWAKCKKCKRNHATILHDPEKERKTVKAKEDKQEKEQEQQAIVGCVSKLITSNPQMAIIPVLVKATTGTQRIATYAFLDNGCGAVFATEELNRRLHTRTKTTKLLIKTLNSEETLKTEVIRDPIQIGNLDGDAFFDLPEIYIKEDMPITEEDIPKQEDLNKWTHLQSIHLPGLQGIKYPVIPKVSLMIGSNVPAASQPLETRTGKIGEPYAIKSPLGWLVYGILSQTTQQAVSVNFSKVSSIASIQKGEEHLEQLFKTYINKEFEEHLADTNTCMSLEDKQFMKLMDGSIIKDKDGHYKTCLPFKDRSVMMPNNQAQALAYAERLKKRLRKNRQLHQQYSKFMADLEEKKYAEKVPAKEVDRNDGRVWYIPHHDVHNIHKPDKVRIVFNCPVRFRGSSLNDQLLQGPDLTNSLFGVLLRWRQEPIAIMSDIEAMYYQVRIHDDDCDMLRYIWWPDGDIDKEPEVYRMKVHVFGGTSSPSCANYALKRTADDNQHKCDPKVTNAIKHDFYVDDFLKSVATEEEAIDLADTMMKILSEGGFKLTKWISNSRNVLDTIPVTARAKEIEKLDLNYDDLPSQRALGVQWCIESDQLQFSMKEVNKLPTRRNILSVMSSIYDPFGITSPFVLKAKMILQELCRDKISWDELIPEDQKEKWDSWLKDLPKLESVKINRCFKPANFGQVVNTQLHHFADASQHGYGTATYLRQTNDKGQVHSEFVIGKARVAPIKPHTIVKMELTAATSAVRIDNMLKRQLTTVCDDTVFWTDSQTVLKYIQNTTTRFPVFIANRLSIIHDGSQVKQWRYIPTKLNPADYASRGMKVEQLASNSQWLKGPAFLEESEENWPLTMDTDQGKEDHSELAGNIQANVVKTQMEEKEDQDAVNQLLCYYSDWKRLRRGVAWWLRMKAMLQRKVKRQEATDIPEYLTTEEIQKAEEEVIKWVQLRAFPQQIKTLQSDTKKESVNADYKAYHQKVEGSLRSLDPKYVNGLLRVGGRLHHAAISEDARHQLILPKNNHVSNLITKYYHEKCHHQGKNHVLNEVRQKYWIIKGGIIVKRILKQCTVCRRHQSKPGNQKMADLPPSRVTACEPPFTYTGIDYFGPFEIKQGRSMKKRYGVIFTCMNSRAVHLEIAESMDTSSCVNALRRFVCRRGQVKEITSDNGSNLCGADRELQQAIQELDPQVLQTWSANSGIQWKFNPPASSHHGGVWERIIRSVRRILQSILREQHVKVARSEEQLQTLMCEVENTLNSRPLTKVSNDPSDLNVITPNDLLQPRNQEQYPTGKFTEEDKYARRRWRQVQFMADMFWKRWVREYLPTLQRRQKWLYPQRNYKVGDVVLVADPHAPRNSWPMGIVQEVNIGNQQLVRSVRVKTQSSTLVRPITKLVLLLEQDQ